MTDTFEVHHHPKMTCFKGTGVLNVQSLFVRETLNYIYYICAEFLHCHSVAYLPYVYVEYVFSISRSTITFSLLSTPTQSQ